MATNQPGEVFVKSGTVNRLSTWGLIAPNTYVKVSAGMSNAKVQLNVAGVLSGLYVIDGITPNVGDIILVTQGTPATDGLYVAASGAWTPILLVSDMPDGFQVNVSAGNSAPSVYITQG